MALRSVQLFKGTFVIACLIAARPVSAQGATTAPGPVAAEEAPVSPEQDRAARGLFDAGTLAFREGRYEVALHHFEEAYRLSQRPLLLFNIGSSFDRLRRDHEALAAFERYLQELPQAPNHQAVEARIVLLRQAIAAETAQREQAEAQAHAALAAATAAGAERAAAAPEQAPAAPPPEREGDGLPPAVFWIGAGVTAATAIVSTWSAFNTTSANDDYLAAPTKRAYEDALSRQSRTNVLIGVTSALAATTLVLALLTDWGGSADTAQASVAQVWVAGDSGGVVFQGKL